MILCMLANRNILTLILRCSIHSLHRQTRSNFPLISAAFLLYLFPHPWPMPMGQVPVLEIDGKFLCQSVAIARYLARQHKLTGRDDWDAAQIDMLIDGVQDLYPSIRPIVMALMAKDEEKKKAEWDKFKSDTLASWLDRYEEFLKSSCTGFFVGKEVTWGDIWIGAFLEWLLNGFDSTLLDGHPQLKALSDKIGQLPNIKKYKATGPETPL